MAAGEKTPIPGLHNETSRIHSVLARAETIFSRIEMRAREIRGVLQVRQDVRRLSEQFFDGDVSLSTIYEQADQAGVPRDLLHKRIGAIADEIVTPIPGHHSLFR